MESEEKKTSVALYYVQGTIKGVDNSMVWICKDNNKGFACDLKLARLWTWEEMEEELKGNNTRGLKAWPKEYIDKRIERHVDLYCVDQQHEECINY